MDLIVTIAAVLGAIMILVFVHELGHFLAARVFKMRVDRFSVGFPPKIFGKKFGETEYVLGATPLGGYVKIAGMVDESMDTDFAESEVQPWEYRAKPLWQRIIVITAGVAFNILLAAVIFSGLKMVYGDQAYLAQEDGFVYVVDSSLAAEQIGMRTGDQLLAIGGRPFDPQETSASVLPLLADSLVFEVVRMGESLSLLGPDDIMTQIQSSPYGGIYGLGIYNEPSIIGVVEEGRPADEAGLEEGDRITSVNGASVMFWEQVRRLILDSDGNSMVLGVQRDGDNHQVAVTPMREESGIYRIGIEVGRRSVEYSPIQAIRQGAVETWDNTAAIAINLRRIVTGREDVRENLGGPVMVARIAGEAARQGGRSFWTIVALLSITLAIVNILPIPVLDGGHLVFLLYEGIFRREPSLKFRMVTQQVGFGIILVLMAFLVYNDLTRL